MSITFIKQDLTTSDAEYICHQVNCQGKMNSGVAKAIREKWPIVYTTYWNTFLTESNLLGKILLVDINEYEPRTWPDQPAIINMFSQEFYGYDGKRYTSYDAFDNCLQKIKEVIPKGSKIAFPYKIGCDRGGANWEVIYTMIIAVLGCDYKIEICYLQEDGWLMHYLDIDWEDK